MGTNDAIIVDVSITTLKSGRDIASQHLTNAIVSEFQHYTFDTGFDFSVSWSGIGLSPENGWYDLAHGSLFVKPNDYVSKTPIPDYSETRDDVELNGHRYTYMNAFSFSHNAVSRNISFAPSSAVRSFIN